VPSIAGKTIDNTNSSLIFTLIMPVNTIYQVDLWGIQVEQGSVATVFVRAGGDIASETALAQRYYYRTTNTLSASAVFGSGMQQTTTLAWAYLKFSQRMRMAPTALESAGTFQFVTTAGATGTVTFGSANDDGAYIQLTGTGGTGGQGGVGRFQGTAGTSYLGFSAEI